MEITAFQDQRVKGETKENKESQVLGVHLGIKDQVQRERKVTLAVQVLEGQVVTMEHKVFLGHQVPKERRERWKQS
ncbi:uncharacterized protein LOC120728520 isoform X2 [Simochromis diagramma]|uniref:uncharacterized protein LOC120728520 isoform X2 n=1 Tax=Simochromis diagramma TaxID=43689 RepID=UPI001A7EC205|nr:uncharacterized protein LOC120728520 isoform X2 [Simochromis diagramma]